MKTIPYKNLYNLIISKNGEEVATLAVDGVLDMRSQVYTFTDYEDKKYLFCSTEFPIKEFEKNGITYELQIVERD